MGISNLLSIFYVRICCFKKCVILDSHKNTTHTQARVHVRTHTHTRVHVRTHKNDQCLSMVLNSLRRELVHLWLDLFSCVFLIVVAMENCGLIFLTFMAGYRNATDLCVLILCPATLLTLLLIQ